MDLKAAIQLFSFRDLRNALIGVVVVLGGLGLSALTLYAQQSGDIDLAWKSALASLAFVVLILIFVVPPLARNAGREASQMNLPFEFTTGGAIILVLLIIVGFSAWNTGNNLLFLVLSFLIASLVIGFFAGSICLKKLDVTMRFPETIFAGEATPILVSIKNRKRIFPAFSVVVDVHGKERERSIAANELDAIFPKWIATRLGKAPVVRRTLNHFIYIGARQTLETKSEHIFPNRGRLAIKEFELSTKFPFGFFRHRRRLPAREAEVIVFPQIDEISSEMEDLPLDLGKRTSSKRGMGQDLLGLRDYQPLDDLRRIDWKATARTHRLTVREFAADDEKRATIIFDTRIFKSGDETPLRERIATEQSGRPVIVSDKFETGARLTASILAHFTEDHAEIRLIIAEADADSNESDNSAGAEFGTGGAHFYESLKRLALTEPKFFNDEIAKKPALDLERILNGSDDSHRIFVTSNGTNRLPIDLVQRLNIMDF